MDEDRILAAIAEGRRESRLGLEALGQGPRAEMAAFRTEMTTFRTETMSRFERIEDKLTSMTDDITVNLVAVTVENSKRDADRKETVTLVEMMTVMHRQMRRMQSELDDLKNDRKAS